MEREANKKKIRKGGKGRSVNEREGKRKENRKKRMNSE